MTCSAHNPLPDDPARGISKFSVRRRGEPVLRTVKTHHDQELTPKTDQFGQKTIFPLADPSKLNNSSDSFTLPDFSFNVATTLNRPD
jgi:hypothetical protein